MRVAVVGTRTASEENYELLVRNIPPNCTEIVSGGASGMDSLAERYAMENGLILTVFKPDFKKYGSAATRIRNELIVKYADFVCAFWDKKSRGTANTLGKCLEFNKPFEVHYIKSTDLSDADSPQGHI